MSSLDEMRKKRKSSLIVVCTLGLVPLFNKDVRPLWMTNIFEGTSMMEYEGAAFVLKAISFFALGALTAALFFIVNFIKLIYYSIEISRF